MKNSIKTIVTVIFLLLVLSGCGVGRILTRNSSRTTERKKVEMVSLVRKDESSFKERGILFNDSSHHVYKVMIFPRDSFSYSVQHGFRGQAERVEVWGSANKLSKGGIYEKSFEISSSDSNLSYSGKSRTVNRSVERHLTKRNVFVFLLLFTAVIIFIGWYRWKFR